jgi:excisionase family DNA binding protein
MEEEFFTIKEFSDKLKVHPSTVRRAIKKGRIQAIRAGSGNRPLYRIPYSEIERIALFDLQEIVKKMIQEELISSS